MWFAAPLLWIIPACAGDYEGASKCFSRMDPALVGQMKAAYHEGALWSCAHVATELQNNKDVLVKKKEESCELGSKEYLDLEAKINKLQKDISDAEGIMAYFVKRPPEKP